MAYHHHSNGGAGGGNGSLRGEYSGDERESRSGGEERLENLELQEKPTYLLEHLATFTVNKESGIVYPADGMRRLLQLEKTTGIWSQKMQLCLDYQWILIIDYETGNVIERFPATLIQEPTAFTSTDAMELYNNILVFIVSGGGGARSEMHIFQSQSVSAVHLVEDLKNLRSGKVITKQRESMEQTQQQYQHHQLTSSASGMTKSAVPTIATVSGSRSRSDHHHHHSHHQRNYLDQYGMRGGVTEQGHGTSGANETDSEHGGNNDETSSTSSDKYERDVTVLNHCFDDIEKFIARLQHAAAASRELEKRRRNRKSKKKDPGEGLLTLRTRPPLEKEFIDIFAKFKLSFNLLAKLKSHIHDPNAPELVHFLFTPLALIVEASSDTYYESQLPARVVNPLLTREAINLLINCVTSKETELWRSLGDAWVIPRDQWKQDVGSYHPVFLDGWSPEYLVIDELESPVTSTIVSKRHMEPQTQGHTHQKQNGQGGNATNAGVYDDYAGSAIMLNEKFVMHHAHAGIERGDRVAVGSVGDIGARSDISIDSIDHGLGVTSAGSGVDLGEPHNSLQAISSGVQNLHMREGKNSSSGGHNSTDAQLDSVGGTHARDELFLESWLDDLQSAGAKIVLVTYPRTANNDKELSVTRGEHLEILDDTRKWWKARNIRGQIAHVPHTIVTPYNYGEPETGGGQAYMPQQHHTQIAGYKGKHISTGSSEDNVEQRSADSAEWVRSKHLDPSYPTRESLKTRNGVQPSPTGNVSIHEELKQVLRTRERRGDLNIHKTPTIYIGQQSPPSDVAAWLVAKEFSVETTKRLAGFGGEELFSLTLEQLEQLFGSTEGRRLASQIQLQKSVSGYKTARSTELQAVLARARPKLEA